MQFSWERISHWVYAEPSQIFTYESFLFKSRVSYTGPWVMARWRLIDEATGEELDGSPFFIVTGEFEVRFPHASIEYGVPCLIVAPGAPTEWRLRAEVVDVYGSVLSSYRFTVKVTARENWRYEWAVVVVKPEEYRTFEPEDFIAMLRSEYPSIRGVKLFFYDDTGTVEVWVETQSDPIPAWLIWLVKVIVAIIIAITVIYGATVLLILFGRRWVCPYCGFVFSSWGDLKIHKMREHPDEWAKYGEIEEESARKIISGIEYTLWAVTNIMMLALGVALLAFATPLVREIMRMWEEWRKKPR